MVEIPGTGPEYKWRPESFARNPKDIGVPPVKNCPRTPFSRTSPIFVHISLDLLLFSPMISSN